MKFNILFTSVGRRVALVKHFRHTLETLGLKGKLIGADATLTAPAIHFADEQYLVPHFGNENYIPTLLEICEKEKIRLLIPLNDYELSLQAVNKPCFSELGTVVHISDPRVIEVALDKLATGRFFREAGIGHPQIYDIQDALNWEQYQYPCLLKPRYGSASKGIHQINSQEELLFHACGDTEYFLQECLKGAEHTLDVFVDGQQRVRCVVPRKRIEIRAGEVSKGVTVRDEKIIEAGRKVVKKLKKVYGVINLQCFLTAEGEVKFIEINPRFGGGIPLSIAAGADFPRWLVEMVLGRDPEIDQKAWESGLYMLRWDEAIFKHESEMEG